MLRPCTAEKIKIIIFWRPSVLYVERSGDVRRLLDHAVCGFQPREIEMKLSYVKAFLVVSALLLSACSAMTTDSCFSESCRQPDANSSKLNGFGSTPLSRSFGAYSSGLLHE